MQLNMNEKDWQFVEGPWAQNTDGIILAPENLADRNLAFYISQTWKDFEAEFEFRWNTVWTDAAFVFRASDYRHYYQVHFPVIGQHARSEHFWALVSKVDDRGYVQVLKMEMIHGVSSMRFLWHRIKVSVQSNTIRVWVDDRPMSPVIDDTYSEPGCVGLSTYSGLGAGEKAAFRNLRVSGRSLAAKPFNLNLQPRRNWFLVTDIAGHGCSNIVRAANGDLLTSVISSMTVDKPTPSQLRSRDHGRSWTVEDLDPRCMNGSRRLSPKGTLELYDVSIDPPFKINRFVSTDHGKTWSEPQAVGEVKFPEEFPWDKLYVTRLLETRNGTICLFAYTSMNATYKTIKGRMYFDCPIPWTSGYCFRSTDGGDSWSDPVDIDEWPRNEAGAMVAKEGSETSVAQTRDGKIIALVRPMRSPVMWETWSVDDGATWLPLTRGPFPMYACNNSMISTTSGALIIGGRFPGMGIQVSFDDGMTWQGYTIDSAIWANGAMFEIEPNVVLFVYGGKDGPTELRAQIMRVTADGIEPA